MRVHARALSLTLWKVFKGLKDVASHEELWEWLEGPLMGNFMACDDDGVRAENGGGGSKVFTGEIRFCFQFWATFCGAGLFGIPRGAPMGFWRMPY